MKCSGVACEVSGSCWVFWSELTLYVTPCWKILRVGVGLEVRRSCWCFFGLCCSARLRWVRAKSLWEFVGGP